MSLSEAQAYRKLEKIPYAIIISTVLTPTSYCNSLFNTMVHRSIGVVLIEDMHVKYIHSNAVLFLKIIINFVQPILPYWMSSLLVVQWTNGK